MSGRCPCCGRPYRYQACPRGDEPGRLSIGKQEARKPTLPEAQPQFPPTANPGQPETPRAQFQRTGVHQNPAPGVAWWRPGLEGLTLAGIHQVASSFWFDISQPHEVMGRATSITCGVDASTGEEFSSSQYSEILDSDERYVLTRAGYRARKIYLQEGTSGECIWQQPCQGAGLYGCQDRTVAFVSLTGPGVRWIDTSRAGASWCTLTSRDRYTSLSMSAGRIACGTASGKYRVWALAAGELIWEGQSTSSSTIHMDERGWAISSNSDTTVYDGNGNALWKRPLFRLSLLTPDWVVGVHDRESEDEVWSRVEGRFTIYHRENGDVQQLPLLGDCGNGRPAIQGDSFWCTVRPDRLVKTTLGQNQEWSRPVPLFLGTLKDNEDVSLLRASGTLFLYTGRGDIVRFSES